MGIKFISTYKIFVAAILDVSTGNLYLTIIDLSGATKKLYQTLL